jgi:hypothetical protein
MASLDIRSARLRGESLYTFTSKKREFEVNMRARPGALWLAAFMAIVALAFIVPYTVLRDVASLWGAYAFWTLLAAVTIALGYIFMLRWRE